uniref:Uncharacterized protein n=1 Tax=Arundo donax TaxID=35708 RepID=A0A0A9F9S9_ARUDO
MPLQQLSGSREDALQNLPQVYSPFTCDASHHFVLVRYLGEPWSSKPLSHWV